MHVKTGIPSTSTHTHMPPTVVRSSNLQNKWVQVLCEISWFLNLGSFICSIIVYCVPHLPGTYILSTSLRFETWLQPPTHGKPPVLSGQVGFQLLHAYFQGKDSCCSTWDPAPYPGAKLPRNACGSPALPPCPSRLAPLRQEVYPFLLISQFPPSSKVLGQDIGTS